MNKIPQTFLENIDMINSATQFPNYENNNDLLNIKPDIKNNNYQNRNNTFFNTNSFSKTQNEYSTYNNKNNNINYRNNNNLKYNKTLDDLYSLNNTRRFAWKEIINNNNDIINDNNLDNPLINNILYSEINEKEIKNIPENYLINLIQTLQCVANKAIEDNNNLIFENNKLNSDLSRITNNFNNAIEKNNKMNQTILSLNKENNEQKNIINNYENNGMRNFDNYEINNITNIKGYKQRYYCPICSNKKFKTQKYLEEHINRRHSDYYQKLFNKKKKFNNEKYENNLNEMRKYIESLINNSLKKTQYIRLHEKLNGIQNLMIMSKYNYDNYYNDNCYDGNYYNYNDFNYYYNEMNIDGKIQDKYTLDNNEKINKYNYNDKVDENKEAIKIINNLEKSIKRVKNEMKQYFDKNIKETLELNNEKKFQAIKKYFESDENQNDNELILNSRRENKVKTIKTKQSKLLESINEDPEDEKTENYDEKKELKRKNKNNFEKKKNNHKNENNSKKNEKELKKEEKSSEEKENSQKDKKISFSATDSQDTEKNIELENFYNNFRNRDGCFSTAKDKYYLKKIIPDNYNINQQKINDIIKEKIDKKLLGLNKTTNTTNEDWISDIIKLYFQILDKKSVYGNVHLFYSRNMNNFLNIKKFVDDANNYYYQGRGIEGMKNYSDISKVLNERSQKVFEVVDCQIHNNEDADKNDFSFGV